MVQRAGASTGNCAKKGHEGAQSEARHNSISEMKLVLWPMIQCVLHRRSRYANQMLYTEAESQFFLGLGGIAARFRAFASFVVRFPISQPQPLRIFTTLGVMAAVKGTLMKMKDLWIAYANAS